MGRRASGSFVFERDLTVSYVEEEERIEQTGDCSANPWERKAEIAFRNLMLEVLPDPVVPPSSVISSRFGEGQSRKPHPPFEGVTFEPLPEGRLVWWDRKTLSWSRNMVFLKP